MKRSPKLFAVFLGMGFLTLAIIQVNQYDLHKLTIAKLFLFGISSLVYAIEKIWSKEDE